MSTAPSPIAATSTYAKYVPRELEYNAGFEDNLMRVVLDSKTNASGIRILQEHDQEAPVDGTSVRNNEVGQLPTINDEELPLALGDSRRVFASPVPGVRLTHPHGFLEGGPGLDPEEDTFARDFLASQSAISDQAELQQLLQSEVESNLNLLRQRMRERQSAIEQNEQIEKKIRTLNDTHDLEMKMHRRMIEEQQAKKQARDQKRQERKGK